MLDKFIAPLILVMEDVHETRDGIEKLLTTDGYRVAPARNELDTIESAQHTQPDLILVSLTGLTGEVLAMVHRLRERMAVRDQIPVVIFYVEDIAEGQEVAIGGNIYLTRPDNFNQLRSLVARLLHFEVMQVHFNNEERQRS
ncbi:MAG TPA: response regulator [Pyrinomonadaceae bacterium]|nr:response regulator [Pyrinomonadaceae bacterium]